MMRIARCSVLLLACCACACGGEEANPSLGIPGDKADTARVPEYGILKVLAPTTDVLHTTFDDNEKYCIGNSLDTCFRYSRNTYYVSHTDYPDEPLDLDKSAFSSEDYGLKLDHEYELPAGSYYLFMNDTYYEVEIAGGEKTQVHAGRINTRETPGELYTVKPEAQTFSLLLQGEGDPDSEEVLPVIETGRGINVMPGTYEVSIYTSDSKYANGDPHWVETVTLDPDK